MGNLVRGEGRREARYNRLRALPDSVNRTSLEAKDGNAFPASDYITGREGAREIDRVGERESGRDGEWEGWREGGRDGGETSLEAKDGSAFPASSRSGVM